MKWPNLSSKQRLLLIIVGTVLLLGVLALVLLGRSILQNKRTDSLAKTYSQVFPLTIARVEGESIRYREVLPRWEAIDVFLTKQAAQIPEGATVQSQETLREEAYEHLLRERYLEEKAARDSFVLRDEVIEQQMSALLARADQQASSTTSTVMLTNEEFLQRKSEFSQELEKIGWTYEQYVNWVVRPALLETALQQRAEVAGESAEVWKTQFEADLQSEEHIKRYLKFSTN